MRMRRNTKAAISDFARKVYAVVRRIPKGGTLTYKEVAELIGNPRAYRAVGNALNKNPFAPQVPCHRVIRSGGVLGGFASGAPKKRKLLSREGVIL